MLKSIFKDIDLTKGSIYKKIIYFTIPIFLSYLFQQIYTLSDAAIVGQFLSKDLVAGVNDTTHISFIILEFAFGCTAGFSVVSAYAIGNNNKDEARKSLLVQIILSFIISIILTIVAILMIKPLLSYIGVSKDINPTTYNAAYTFLFTLFLGTISIIFYNLACSFLRSLGNSLVPLIFLIISAILNIILDFLFIAVFKFGVIGAASATVISQTFSAIISFSYIFIKLKEYRFKRSDFKFEKGFILKHLKLGLPLALQFSILAFGLITMQATAISFDRDITTGVLSHESQLAYGASSKFTTFLMTPFVALGTGMLGYSGQNLGSKDKERIKKGIKAAYILMLILYVIILIIGLLLSINGFFLHIFLSGENLNDKVIKYAKINLLTILPFFFILGSLFILRNTLQGLEKPVTPFLAGIMELIARVVICLTLPRLVSGGIVSNQSPDIAYVMMSLADVFSWVLANVVLVVGLIRNIISKKGLNKLVGLI